MHIYGAVYILFFVYYGNEINLDMCNRICYTVRRSKKHGSDRELQLSATCIGEVTTYTTGIPAPTRVLYPFW